MVTLDNGRLHIEISEEGAEIQRIQDAQGIDRLWGGDPAFWAGRSPVLFPVAGALKDDAYTLDGVRYSLAKHGFARVRTFSVEEKSGTAATFLLAGVAGEEPGFPFPYAFRVRYALDGDTLIVSYITENQGGKTFWYGVGAHEAYACPEGIEAYELVFDQPETLMHNVLDGSLLSGEMMPVPMQGNVLPLHEGLFANDSLVLGTHRSRGVTLRCKVSPREVRVEFADFDAMLIWKMAGAGFLCIEPWTNLPDRTDADGDITRKPGMIALAPGEMRTLTHTIRFT